LAFESQLAREVHTLDQELTVIVAWPEKVLRSRLRQQDRLSVHLACSAKYPDEAFERGVVEDISQEGCGVVLRRALEPGELLNLAITLDCAKPARWRRLVVRNRRSLDCSRFFYGCSFHAQDPAAREELASAIARWRLSSAIEAHDQGHALVLTRRAEALAEEIRMLHGIGIEAVPVDHAVELGLCLSSGSPRAVMIDAEQDGLDPQMICRFLRSTARFGSLPVIVFGGHTAKCGEYINAGASLWAPSLSSPELVKKLV
jgi:CheY-like chemotaxis protein